MKLIILLNFDIPFATISNIVTTYGIKIIGAIFALIIGLWVIKILMKVVGKKIHDTKYIDDSLSHFFISLIGATLKVLLVVSVMGMVGIHTTSFIAVLGAAGLAVGMALSGTLQNFAGGVLILILKPYKVGDFIEAQGHSGVVNEIHIFNTVLKTGDNKLITIPNSPLSTGTVVNYSAMPERRVDFTFGIGYGDSTSQTREVLKGLIDADERILKTPEPLIVVAALADSSVNFTVRVWVKSADYWGVFFDMNEKVYNKFNEVGINIPFPQMDVHLQKD